LTLIPGNTIRCPWNLVTSSFIESSLLGLVISLAVLFLTANVAEAVYGPIEFAKLIAVAAFSSGSVCFVVQYIMFVFTRRGSALFSETGGFTGVQGALFVAIKHVLPGQEVLLLPGVAVSTQYLPGIFLVVCTFWSLVTADIGLLRCVARPLMKG
jgi:membrane associated rhomboid family serine protease